MHGVTEHEERPRYDDIADGYDRWWAPVIAGAAIDLLDHLGPRLGTADPTGHLLDLGTGTGTLAGAALARWPGIRVTGADPSTEMLALARVRVRGAEPDAGPDERFRTVTAFADTLPFADATFDGAMSSFVLQLVPDRHRALRELRRVLRPGAPLGFVTWVRSETPYAPDRVLDDLLEASGFDPREPAADCGDLPSVETAAHVLRRAGFRDVSATPGMLEHRWDAAGYLAFVEHFDEASTFEAMEPDERGQLRARLLEALSALSAEELTLRLPIAYATGIAGTR